jgi:hypothetical protein
MTTTTTTKNDETAKAVETPETVSPIQMTNMANDRLKALDLKVIPPQMVYNYIRNGLISAEKHGLQVTESEDGRKHYRIPTESATAWVEKYVNGRLERARKQIA